jgi:hypothetical protein
MALSPFNMISTTTLDTFWPLFYCLNIFQMEAQTESLMSKRCIRQVRLISRCRNNIPFSQRYRFVIGVAD